MRNNGTLAYSKVGGLLHYNYDDILKLLSGENENKLFLIKNTTTVNCIRHFNVVFARVRKAFSILHEEVISLCRIGSMNTYTRCLKELHSYEYIRYQ